MALKIKNGEPVCGQCGKSIECMDIFITEKLHISFAQEDEKNMEFEVYNTGDTGVVTSFLLCPCGETHTNLYELECEYENSYLKIKKE